MRQQPPQCTAIARRKYGDDRRLDHRLRLSLVVLVRRGLGHDLGQGLVMRRLVMRNLVGDFLSAFVVLEFPFEFVSAFVMLPLMRAGELLFEFVRVLVVLPFMRAKLLFA